MTPIMLAAAALAGGIGAGLRYLMDRLFAGRAGVNVGVLLANVTGSFALGILTGLGAALESGLLFVLGVGLLGGFTTFSAVSVEVALAVERARWKDAATALFGTLGLALVAAALGIWLASGSVVLTQPS